jgi:hypothetical protein
MTSMDPALAAAPGGLASKLDAAALDARSARDEARRAHEEARAARELATTAPREARAARAEGRAAFDTITAETRERDRIAASLAVEVRGVHSPVSKGEQRDLASRAPSAMFSGTDRAARFGRLASSPCADAAIRNARARNSIEHL